MTTLNLDHAETRYPERRESEGRAGQWRALLCDELAVPVGRVRYTPGFTIEVLIHESITAGQMQLLLDVALRLDGGAYRLVEFVPRTGVGRPVLDLVYQRILE